MKKMTGTRLFLLLALLSIGVLQGMQGLAQVRHRIAVFAPLYLDSAFDGSEYRYAKNVFPKFINPGLEFYEGAQLALDSLNKEGVPLDAYIYDTRSVTEGLADELKQSEKDSVDLIIAYCSANEVKVFADEGLKRNIPVINANLPNDGGVTGNPFFIVLNSTLKAQCEGVYRHIQKNYPLDKVVMFKKKGVLEDRIKAYFDDFARTTNSIPLKIKYVDLTDSFSVNTLRAQLDSNSHTICVAGSLDENFGKRLVQQLAGLSKHYPLKVVGMPTWDNINFARPEYKNVEIIYSVPFFIAKTDKLSANISYTFSSKMFAKPSDVVFKGYEVTWRYAKLLNQYGKDLASNLSSKQYKVFTDFDIQPVLSKQNMTLDYFENKKLYFLTWMNGVISSINY